MKSFPWKIGDLAEETGLTVKTLHHYDDIGLLTPSMRDTNEYRLYTEEDLMRLQQIVTLRQLEFPLEEIKTMLEKPDFSPVAMLQLQVTRMKTQMEQHQEAFEKLEGFARLLSVTGKTSPEDFIAVIKAMNVVGDTFNAEEMQEIRERGKKLGKEKIVEAEHDWQSLMAAVKKEMDAGTDPLDPKVLALGKQWKALVSAFSGGNPQIEKKMGDMYRNNPSAASAFGGPDPKMFAYIGKAMSSL